MPLPSTPYHYMERSTAKVSSDFHVQFDNAYYSVDKAFLYKKVVIRATAREVKIFSIAGDLLAEWPRACHKGEWCANPKHLPRNYRDFSEWNGIYFIRKASTLGPNTALKQHVKIQIVILADNPLNRHAWGHYKYHVRLF